jgi:hypothetical protein
VRVGLRLGTHLPRVVALLGYRPSHHPEVDVVVSVEDVVLAVATPVQK